jgi:hypothetical protein
VTTAHTGSVPSAGPEARGGFGGPGGVGGGRGFGAGTAFPGRPGGSTGARPSFRGGPGGFPGATGGAPPGAARPTGARSAGGGPGGGVTTSTALKQALEADASRYRWVAATSGSQSAASLELATGGAPVMAIGGFDNEGGHLSLAAFERYVAQGDIHYYIASRGAGGPGGGGSTNAITSWVESHYRAVTIGGQTVYDLTQPRS